MRKIAIITLGLLAAALTCAPAPGRAQEPPPSPRSVIFVDGKDAPHSLEEFTGQAVLVNLWASWCAPCVEEMPALDALQKDYRDRGLKVIAVSEDFKRDKAEAFFREESLEEMDLYFDVASALLRSYRVNGLPLTVLYGKDGDEVERFTGATAWGSEEVRRRIEAALK